MKERLDKYLVNNNFTSTRTKSKELIKSNNVKVNDRIVTKIKKISLWEANLEEVSHHAKLSVDETVNLFKELI